MDVLVIFGVGLYIILRAPKFEPSLRPIRGNPNRVFYSGVWETMVNTILGQEANRVNEQ